MTQTLDRSHPPYTPEDFDFELSEIAPTARRILGSVAVEGAPENPVDPEVQKIRDEFSERQKRIREAKLGESIWPQHVRSANRVSLSIEGEKIQAFPIGSELAITPTGTLFLVAHRDIENTGAVSWKEIGSNDLSDERALDVENFFNKESELEHYRSALQTVSASSTTTGVYIDQYIDRKYMEKHHPFVADLDI